MTARKPLETPKRRALTIYLTQPQYRALWAAVSHHEVSLGEEDTEYARQERETLERAWAKISKAWVEAG